MCRCREDRNHMRKEGSNHGKFKHYILAPFRILNKARQLYMKGVVECAGGYGYGGAGVGTLSPAVHYIPPPLYQTNCLNLINSSRTRGDDGEGQGEEEVPIKNAENENETRLALHRQRQPFVGYKYNRNKMSYSTEVRMIGRIEEDQPCYFEEDQMDDKTHLLYLYPRRRSNVVNKSTVYYH